MEKGFLTEKINNTLQKRRIFLRNMAIASAGAALPFSSCFRAEQTHILPGRDPDVFSEKEWEILIAVQDVLFPPEPGAPGARDVNAAGFFQWVVSDPLLDEEERIFRKNGLTWIDETAMENRGKAFTELDDEIKEEVLRYAERSGWGESWLSAMLLHIFEALLSDPVYGGNTAERGWKWLDYKPGMPRPVKGKIYGDYRLSDGSWFQKPEK